MLHRLVNRFAVGGIPQPRRVIVRAALIIGGRMTKRLL